MGTVLVVQVGETLINGFFFGQNVAGSFLGGIGEAVLYSTLNVLVIGGLAGFLFYRFAHPSLPISKRMGGYFGVVLMGISAFFFNLFVGHYRDALDSKYPTGGTCNIYEIEQAGQEALCLFRNYGL